VGTACLQVAKGYGARTIAVVSTPEKGEFAKAAGADEIVLLDGFLTSVKELTDGHGVDIVVDVVGGDLMTDSLRCLGTQGRLLVVGFTAGNIPVVKVNRLLLNNIDVRGVGWGAYAMVRRGYMRQQWDQLLPMMEAGVVAPPSVRRTRSTRSGRHSRTWRNVAPWGSRSSPSREKRAQASTRSWYSG